MPKWRLRPPEEIKLPWDGIPPLILQNVTSNVNTVKLSC